MIKTKGINITESGFDKQIDLLLNRLEVLKEDFEIKFEIGDCDFEIGDYGFDNLEIELYITTKSCPIFAEEQELVTIREICDNFSKETGITVCGVLITRDCFGCDNDNCEKHNEYRDYDIAYPDWKLVI